MTLSVTAITEYLESIAPGHLQEHYDNAGLLVGNPEQKVEAALICLDSTPDIIQEARRRNCGLVIAHHPIIFRGLKQITGANYVQRTVIEAIKNDIAIYAIHTNLDNVLHHGVNSMIARKIGLKDTRILAPKDPATPDIGSGLIGRLEVPLAESEFLDHLLTAMSVQMIKHTALTGRKISRVAVCGGSGSFLLSRAIAEQADIYVSADFKYHEYFDAEGKILIADIGHYESEQHTVTLIQSLLTQNFPNFAALCAETNTNPIKYYGKTYGQSQE